MQIVPLDTRDSRAVDQYFAFRQAVSETHWWESFEYNWDVERIALVYPPVGQVQIKELAWDGDSVIGGLNVDLMTEENKHHANAQLHVHPAHANNSVWARLLERIFELVVEHGRTQVSLLVHKPLDGEDEVADAEEEFLRSSGFEVALELVDREADVNALSREAEDQLLAEAREASRDYEVISWVGQVPEEFLQPLIELDRMAMTQVPLGSLDLEDVDMNVERRLATAARHQAANLTLCQTVARHRSSNRVVANTEMIVFPEPSNYAWQGITLVAPDHRGHRLGQLMKLVNLRQLRERAPHVQRIHTENAQDNEYMNGINERMGLVAYQIGREYIRKEL